MILIYFTYIYLIIGLLTYLILVLAKKLQKIDEDTSNTGIGFKLLILPGMLVLWPLLLFKLLKKQNNG